MQRRIPLISYLIAGFIMVAGIGFANPPTEADVKTWVKILSVQHDVRAENFCTVFHQLYPMDAEEACGLISELERKGPASNKRYRIRLNAIKALLGHFNGDCISDNESHRALMEEATRLAFELDDPQLIADACQWYVQILDPIHDIGKYSFYAISAADMQDQNGEDQHYDIALWRYRLGHFMHHTREYEKAAQYSRQALSWRLDTVGEAHNDDTRFEAVMNAWNTIGLANLKLGRLNDAFAAFDSAAQWVDRAGKPVWHGIIAGNRGDTYFVAGEYDKAVPLLYEDYTLSMKYALWDNAANSLHWVATIQLLQGNPRLALNQLREAMELLNKMPRPEYEAGIYFAMADAHLALQQYDSSLLYRKKYHDIQRPIETAVSQAQSEISRLRVSETENIFKVQHMLKERSRILLIRNLSVALIIVTAAFGFLLLHRQKLKLRMKEQQVLDAKRLAEAEAIHAQTQLRQFTKSLLEKSELIEKLRTQVSEQTIHREQQQILSDLSRSTILTDEDWERFKDLFEQVYPGFFLRLRESAKGITPAEQRMAALHRLQLTTREAASILAVSQDAVHKTRQRLRQRIFPDNEGDVDAYIASL